MTDTEKLTSTPDEYKEWFEVGLEKHINEEFGNELDFIEDGIRFFDEKLFYIEYKLDIIPSNISPPYHQDVQLEGIMLSIKNRPSILRNKTRRKLEFLRNMKEPLTDVGYLSSLMGKMKFDSNLDLIELALALRDNSNWSGSLVDLCHIFGGLSKRPIKVPSNKTTEVRGRTGDALFLARLINKFESKS
tara:strand:- start:222 stop:788 length:567 start_codon:yes stop_codon:yes gene_type:complete